MKLRLVSIDDQPEPTPEPPAVASGPEGAAWALVAAVADVVSQPLLIAVGDSVAAANDAMRRLADGGGLVGRKLAEIVETADPLAPMPAAVGDEPGFVFLRLAKALPPVPARLHVTTAQGADGPLRVVIADGIDAIEPRHAALRDSEARFRGIVDTLPLPVAISRLEDDRLIFVNEQWCTMTGLEREDVLGCEVTDFYANPEDRERLKGALTADGAVRQFLTRLRFGSRTLWVELRAITMEFAGHAASLSVFQDVTDSKEHERQLVEAKEAAETANRTKSEFLASMSHELRTPLNAILGFSELIEMQALGPIGHPRYIEYARDINESGNLLLRMIDDVLDLAKMEAGKLALVEEVFDTADMLAAAMLVIQPLASAGKIALSTDPGSNWFRLRGDKRRVTQILINLLSNAVKFTPAGGRVMVDARVTATGAGIMSVSDTGIGISAEDIERLTEPFVQLESAMTRRFRGSGLGLAIARSLGEMHGARIAIESELGRGTTVRVAFPPERVVVVQ
ncbi:MAG: PAS domain-containing sensor histidine kinase [Alphaproteobacteria bacterium]|nr:PAS domain-containing sensor histidine kinase [Alphaproteobacteria bacterium]